MTIDPPAPPYLGPPAHTSSGSNKPIMRVVIHCTVSPCVPGGARQIAAYFRSPAAGGSAHYVVDPTDTVQACYDSVIAWHAPPNQHSLGVELCDPMKGPGTRWLRDLDHRRMLDRAAELVAQLCLAYDVPIQRVDVADLRAGRKGICGHADVSDAFHESTHWDPGPAFPWERFMDLVRDSAKQLTNAPGVDRPSEEQHRKEAAVPSRVTRARRLLRRAFRRSDDIHRRRAIAAGLRELPER